MALPRKLKNMNLFNDGNSYLGVAKSVTLPSLGRKMESYRGGGMNGPVKADLGFSDDGIQLEWKTGGLDLISLRQFGATKASGVPLRLRAFFSKTTPVKTARWKLLCAADTKLSKWVMQHPGKTLNTP